MIKSIKMIKFKGVVMKGLGEGAYYVEIYKNKIEKILNIIPFLGTLNLKCDNFWYFEPNLKFKKIEGFNGLKGVKFIECRIRKNEKDVNAWIVIPEIRKHNFVEIISDVCLRDVMNLKDGDEVEFYV